MPCDTDLIKTTPVRCQSTLWETNGDVKIVYILLICPVRTGDYSLNCGSVIMRKVLRCEFINHCFDSGQFLYEIWTVTTQQCCQFKKQHG